MSLHGVEADTAAFSLSWVGGLCRAEPERVFCYHVERRGARPITRGHLSAGICGYRDAFMSARVPAGEIVLIFQHHSPEQYFSYVGAMAAGLIPSFMPLPSTRQDPIRYWASHKALMDRLKPAAVVTDAEHATAMREAGMLATGIRVIETAGVRPRDGTFDIRADSSGVALLQHSSGTTGLKKGVMLTHGAIAAQVGAYTSAIGLSKNHRIASWLPLYHDMGLIAAFITPLIMGSTIVALDPFHWVAAPMTLLRAISDFRAHYAWLPNFAFEHLCRTYDGEHYDLSSMLAFINCSEPCRADTFDHFVATFAGCGVRHEMLQVCYAAAETVFAITQTGLGQPYHAAVLDPAALQRRKVVATNDPGAYRVLSVGRPIQGQSVQIMDDAGAVVADGSIGQVVISGRSQSAGYFALPDESAKKFKEGVYHSNDIGFIEDGELYILGRRDDLIIVNGRNYYAHEIEALANATGLIKPGRAVAFGLENAVMGSQDVVVVAEIREGLGQTANDASRRIKDEVLLSSGLILREVRFVPPGWLVKTSSGKISRSDNQTKFAREFRKPPNFSSTPPIHETVEANG